MQLCAENILLDVHSIVSIDEKISLDLSSFVMDRGFNIYRDQLQIEMRHWRSDQLRNCVLYRVYG